MTIDYSNRNTEVAMTELEWRKSIIARVSDNMIDCIYFDPKQNWDIPLVQTRELKSHS